MTTFAGLYCDSVTTPSGHTATGATVTVYVHGTSTVATLYADRTKGATAANPTVTDANGNLVFYADPGLYDCVATTGSFTVAVPIDPSDLVHTHDVASGGTGLSSVTAGSYLVGAGTSAMTEQTPAQVAAAIGAMLSSFSGASDLTNPLWKVSFTDTPLTTDANVAEWWYVNAAVARLAAWLNEIGHYRAEQQTGTLYDHLITLIASFSTGTGRLIRFQRRDGSNTRVDSGGINQDGRLETTLYSYSAPASYGANYSQATTDGYGNAIGNVGVRLVTDDRVELRGGILVGASASVNSDVMFTLPAASWYPAQSRGLNLGASSGTAVPALVRANGTVTIQRASVTTGTVIWLDGQTYKL